MAHRNFSMIDYFSRRCREVQPRLSFRGRSKQEWQTWRAELLSELKALLGEFPQPVPLAAEVVWEAVEDGLIKQRIVLDSEEHMSVPALLYIPADRKRDQATAGACEASSIHRGIRPSDVSEDQSSVYND